MICGIDNGVDGGIVLLDRDGSILRQMPMPVRKVKRGRKNLREVVCREVVEVLKEARPILTLVERPAGAQSAAAAVSMQDSLATIRTCLELLGACHVLIGAKEWQRTFWKTPKKEDRPEGWSTKVAALETANRLWTSHSFLATKRSRVVHDGLVDAALIAEYGRRYLKLETTKTKNTHEDHPHRQQEAC